ASGVRARLSLVAAGRARVQLTETAGRFKYVRVTALPAPQRLVIDLYRTAPPSSPAAEIMKGPNGCLELTSVQRTGRSFRVRGIEHDVFEGSFVVRVRNAAGRVVGSRVVTARGGWSQTVPYRVTAAQSGTVEAVAASAKDGSLACLVQVRVALAP
ncbi:MAG: Immunoglobulin-like domain of bacterial spore germination, partial [Solirubrobacteraceae bacterium]|nr:Immunoglobulin-like domain of bacterial spore germination [Solirubrobacteraceae bacterium]